MAKSKLKKEIKKLKKKQFNNYEHLQGWLTRLQTTVNSLDLHQKFDKSQIEELSKRIDDIDIQSENDIRRDLLQAKIDELKAQKCECHTNTQKTNKISTAGQESGNLGQSVATWFDEFSELTEEQWEELKNRKIASNKQLKFEMDGGATEYCYVRAIRRIKFDKSCYLYLDGDEDSLGFNNIIPDAETQYLAFIQDKQQEILTLRVRTNNG